MLLLGCDTETRTAPSGPPPLALVHTRGPMWGEWAVPVHVGPPISSPARELAARLSPDELSLYLASDRVAEGSQGAFDIWVSRRDCIECPWQTLVNLGPNINSARGDGAPVLSNDGHLLFFSGSRSEGSFGGEDIWVAFRANPKDDFGWAKPVNLGPFVNTAADEGGPAYVPVSHGKGAELYFSRAGILYRTLITRTGEVLEPASTMTELGGAVGEVTVRRDGREMLFWSTRAGGEGGSDIWVSTRESLEDPWSTPRSLGRPVSTTGGELTPSLSHDGNTLYFAGSATRGQSLGFQDVWMTTRSGPGAPR
jgi:hypothetical protein